MIKVELHAHTSDDPGDRIPHDTHALLDRAARFGYGAMAITLHNRWFDPAPFAEYAAARGLVLLSGIERTIDGKHILLINAPREAADLWSFDDMRELKRQAPDDAGGRATPLLSDLQRAGRTSRRPGRRVDALEVNAMFTRGLDYNRRARDWAAAHGKALVGNTDLHRLDQIGTTWSEVDAPPDANAICAAIRAGRVVVRARPLSWTRARGRWPGWNWAAGDAAVTGRLKNTGSQVHAVSRGFGVYS